MSAMEGRVCIVTGANTGIGLETARGLARRGATVVLATRDVQKGEAARKDIVKTTGHASVEVLRLDLASLASVRSFAEAFQERHGQLHVLVNNAGIHTATRQTTEDGHELTFATNHLGHFLLTHLLLDLLQASQPSRIVHVASEAHRFGRMDWDDLQGEGRYNGLKAYNQSKLANVLFSHALARRLAGTGVTSNAVHPGSVASGWAQGEDSGWFRHVVTAVRPFLIVPSTAARGPLRLATDPALAETNGSYHRWGRAVRSSRASRDVDAQERLWQVSLAMTGLSAR